MLENIYKGEVADNGFDAENFFIKGEKDDFIESHRSEINMFEKDRPSSSSSKDSGYSNVLERPSDNRDKLEKAYGGGGNNGNSGIGGGGTGGGGGPGDGGDGGSSNSDGGRKTMSNNQKYALKGLVAK